jgi:2-methylisocitrate lyase-like PEP mutase family enzyme
MIEDQEETGQTFTASPGLCDPDVMCQRIETIRRTVGDELKILARTDYLADMGFEESIERLSAYLAAGADWVLPVFVPSAEALAAATAAFPETLFLILVPGPDGYLPDHRAVQDAGALAILVTSQQRNAFAALQDAYTHTLAGEWGALKESMCPPGDIGAAADFGAYDLVAAR